MAKFKKGDRVQMIIDEEGLIVGNTGTIEENESQIPYVLWDHDISDLGYEDNIKCMYEYNMKLINQEPNYEIY